MGFVEKLGDLFGKALADEMIASGKFMEFGEDETVIQYGDNLRFFPIITKGTVRIMQRDENNNELLLYYLGENESCAMAYVTGGTAATSELRVVTESEVELLAIPHEKLDEWIVRFPEWRNYIFSGFTHRFNEMLKSIDSIAFHKLDERLSDYLKTKAKITGRNTLALSHSQIAEELGTNRVVISRLLKQLENHGKLILYRNEIKLLQNFNSAKAEDSLKK